MAELNWQEPNHWKTGARTIVQACCAYDAQDELVSLIIHVCIQVILVNMYELSIFHSRHFDFYTIQIM